MQHPFRALLFASTALLLAEPATASPAAATPAPTPSPSSVAGPPDGLIAPPPVTTRPQPQPFPTPAPAPAPTPTPAPVRPPTPRADAAERPAAPPRATSPAAPTPAPTEAAPQPDPELSTSIAPAGPDGRAPPPAPVSTSVPPPSVEPRSDGYALPILLGAAALVLGLGAGGFLLWRRRGDARALPAPASVPGHAATPPAPGAARTPQASPAPRPAPPTPAAPAAPVPTSLGRRADLGIAFEALSAQSTLLNLRIRYAITIRNSGLIPASPVRLRIGLFAGSHARPEGIAQWFATSDEALHHGVDAIPAGGEFRFEGELAAPLDALNPITVDGRVLAIPLVAVDARYNHPPGEAPIDGQSARAFVIGRDSGRAGAKLAPFRLDQGPTSFAPLGQRDTGITRVA